MLESTSDCSSSCIRSDSWRRMRGTREASYVARSIVLSISGMAESSCCVTASTAGVQSCVKRALTSSVFVACTSRKCFRSHGVLSTSGRDSSSDSVRSQYDSSKTMRTQRSSTGSAAKRAPATALCAALNAAVKLSTVPISGT